MMVLAVGLEVRREITDTLAENGDLDLGRPGILLMRLVAGDERSLLFLGECHPLSSSSPFLTNEDPNTAIKAV
jgi:hypothetical protein